MEAPPFRVCLFLPPPTTTKVGWNCQARKFILQEHPIKWLMDSMRHKAGVKGAGGIKGKDV